LTVPNIPEYPNILQPLHDRHEQAEVLESFQITFPDCGLSFPRHTHSMRYGQSVRK